MAAKFSPQVTKQNMEGMDQSKTESALELVKKKATELNSLIKDLHEDQKEMLKPFLTSLEDTLQEEPRQKKQRKYAIDDEHCADILPPSKPVATFYLVDAECPLRKQIYVETLEGRMSLTKEYDFFDLCRELHPMSEPKGKYQFIRGKPPVYMFTFEVTEQANRAKLTQFDILKDVVANNRILPNVQGVTNKHGDAVIHFNVLDLDKYQLHHTQCVKGLLSLIEIVRETGKITEDFKQKADAYAPILKLTSEENEGLSPQSEAAINAVFIKTLRETIFRESEFHVEKSSIGMTSRCISKYDTSLQDIIIYHKTNYAKKGIVTGAVVNPIQEEGEYDKSIEGAECNPEESVIVGSAYEMKLMAGGDHWGQLVANMVKLAGQLCEKCICASEECMLIKEIKIYGVLIEIKTSTVKPACLQIRFNRLSTLSIGEKWINIAECMHGIQAVLSAE